MMIATALKALDVSAVPCIAHNPSQFATCARSQAMRLMSVRVLPPQAFCHLVVPTPSTRHIKVKKSDDLTLKAYLKMSVDMQDTARASVGQTRV